MAKKEKRKWKLLQSRVPVGVGKKVDLLAFKEGLSAASYVRRLIIKHLEQLGELGPGDLMDAAASPE